jgi:hypothetical protein
MTFKDVYERERQSLSSLVKKPQLPSLFDPSQGRVWLKIVTTFQKSREPFL